MAMKMGCIVFEDYKGKQAKIVVRKVGTLNDVETLAGVLGKYSRAKIISASITETKIWDNFNNVDFGDMMSTENTEHYDRVEQKAKVLYRDADTGDSISMSIPAPNDNVFNAHQEVKSDVAEDIADAIAAATTRESNDMMYRGGALIGKMPSVRAKVMTGV